MLVGEAIVKMADNRRNKGSERKSGSDRSRLGLKRLSNLNNSFHSMFGTRDEEAKKAQQHNELVAHFKMRRLSFGQSRGLQGAASVHGGRQRRALPKAPLSALQQLSSTPSPSPSSQQQQQQQQQRSSSPLQRSKSPTRPAVMAVHGGAAAALHGKLPSRFDQKVPGPGTTAPQQLVQKPTLPGWFDSLHLPWCWGPWLPDCWKKKTWDLAIITIVVFQSLYIPYAVCFRPPSSLAWWCADLFFDVVFLLDVAITFNIAIRDTASSWITDRRAIARAYVKSWFFVDAIASVPFDIILSSNGDAAVLGLLKAMRLPRLLRLLKLLRVLRFSKLLRNRPDILWWLQYSKHSNLLRVFRMVIMICVVLHYHSCVFYLTVSQEDWMGMRDCDWSWDERPTRPSSHSSLWYGTESDEGAAVFIPCWEASFRSRYISAYYSSLLLLQGEDIAPRSLVEKCYCAFSILSGSILVAIIFGNVSMLIANLSASTSAYHSKMEKLFNIMNHLELPVPLRRRVIKYYEEIWKQYRSLDGHIRMFVPELNSSLRAEVYVYIRTNLILGVPFLRNCSPDVVKELVMRMTEEVGT